MKYTSGSCGWFAKPVYRVDGDRPSQNRLPKGAATDHRDDFVFRADFV